MGLTTIFSDRHRQHATAGELPESPRNYAEVPGRADAIRNAIVAARLGPIVGPEDHGTELILRVHDTEYVAYLQSISAALREMAVGLCPMLAIPFISRTRKRYPEEQASVVKHFAYSGQSPILEGTWAAVYYSAQVALSAAARVREGADRVVYALCRPPGHHAGSNVSGGFCYLNNAAIAARALQARSPARVAILDIDYHHGNGTQEIFYHDPTVMYCSLHADPELAYPYYWGGPDERGEKPGAGSNRNWPLPLGTDDQVYLAALQEALAVIRAFRPSYLVVSAGFDTMEDDPVTAEDGFILTTSGLATIAAELSALDLPTVIVQEGGYAVDRLGEYAVTFLKGFR
jgi:acetoin utilization deacetylase AcuC-like enzyme